MKQILIILGLFASVTTFAQSPRIKLNQITKDTVKGSVLISSPSDSGMVYSRDFYIAYGADTVLILYGDTLAATSGIISSVLSDGVTITGDGTTGNELKVDTSLIATIKALNDSLATISASTTPDGVTITGDGSVGNPLKVDTATVISTIKGLVDTLTNRGYLTANQTITLSGDVTGSGTTAITATVVDDSHNHIISNVDFLQDSLDAKANDSDLANYVTLSGTDTITGAKTFTNTFTQSGGDANFDSGTLFVLADSNRVGIGTSSPQATFDMQNGSGAIFEVEYTTLGSPPQGEGVQFIDSDDNTSGLFVFSNTSSDGAFHPAFKLKRGTGQANNTTGLGGYFMVDLHNTLDVQDNTRAAYVVQGFEDGNTGNQLENANLFMVRNALDPKFYVEADGEVVIPYYGNGSSSQDLGVDLNGKINIFTSDERLKQKTNDEVNAIAKIKLLNPLYYKWLDFESMGTKEYFGFFAQDIQNVMPSAVYNVGQTDYYGYNKTAIIALNTKAIQEQQAIIETQASEIDQLKTLITDLINRLTILENK